MVRRRRKLLPYLLGTLLLLAPSLHAPTAYSASGDPPAGSPAGAVYQLPLGQGRLDGAPKLGGGAGGGSAGGGGGAGAGTGSLYRTENNFGSSSQVPGLAAGAAVAAGGASADGGDGGGAGGRDSAGGPGSVGKGGPGAGGAETQAAAIAADAGNTSVAAGIALLGAIGLLAAGAGVLSRRVSH